MVFGFSTGVLLEQRSGGDSQPLGGQLRPYTTRPDPTRLDPKLLRGVAGETGLGACLTLRNGSFGRRG